MKQVLNLSLFFFFFYPTFGSTYYFSSTEGNDNYSVTEAQSPATPWRSIEKLNSIFKNLLKPGDIIRFKCGDVFFGEINIYRSGLPNAPIILEEYGTGEKPTLTTSISIKNWSGGENNIYQTTISQIIDQLHVLTIDGIIIPKGRFPNEQAKNSGYLSIEKTNKGNINSREVGKMPDFTGGEIVIRKNNWIIDRHRILSQEKDEINFETNESRYSPQIGYGFFIQDHPGTLDTFGEWFFDKNEKRLFLFNDKSNMDSLEIQVSIKKQVIKLGPNSSHIIFRNLSFSGANEYLVALNRSVNIEFKNCSFSYSGNLALHSSGSKNLRIEDCTIENILNGGIYLSWEDKHTLIKNNHINNIFNFPGMGQNGDMHGMGIYVSETSSDVSIESNRINNIGYIPINFSGDNVVIKNNLITNYNNVKDDGAAIYTYNGTLLKEFKNRTITQNLIFNGIGAVDGTKPFHPDDIPYVEGIYLDNNTSNVEIIENYISNIKGSGIFFHDATDIKVINNTVYNAGFSLKFSYGDMENPLKNLLISGNNFILTSEGERHIKLIPSSMDINQLGEFENNFFYTTKNSYSFQNNDLQNNNYNSLLENFKKWLREFKVNKSSEEPALLNKSNIIVP
jgi:hypothetical protein